MPLVGVAILGRSAKKMKCRHWILLPMVWLFAGLTGACHNEQRSAIAVEHEIYLNQCLLRDAVTGMTKMWGIDIRLAPNVAEIDDLWIDYSPKSAVSLDAALDEIITFVAERHAVDLEWSIEGGSVLITGQTRPNKAQ